MSSRDNLFIPLKCEEISAKESQEQTNSNLQKLPPIINMFLSDLVFIHRICAWLTSYINECIVKSMCILNSCNIRFYSGDFVIFFDGSV